MPSRDIDLILLSPLTVPTASSIGLVNKVSISSGAAFAYPVNTVSWGYLIGGKSSWGSFDSDITPNRITPTKIMTVVTGRLVEKSGNPIFYLEDGLLYFCYLDLIFIFKILVKLPDYHLAFF